ncbi:MAG TPA: hypothetical protein VK324_11365, partial [Tepidisphaeraceae bacterium]|nr:hypothetical protein [Tepidisphaeraceae bacterium]
GHYRTFVQLAEQILPAPAVAKRWAEMLDAEAVLIQRQPPGPRMHGGLPCIRGDGEKERTSPAKRTSFISRAGDGPTRIGASCKASNPDAPPTSLRFRTPRR